MIYFQKIERLFFFLNLSLSVAVKLYPTAGWERAEYEKVKSEIHGILSAVPNHKNICEIYGVCLQYPVSDIPKEYFYFILLFSLLFLCE